METFYIGIIVTIIIFAISIGFIVFSKTKTPHSEESLTETKVGDFDENIPKKSYSTSIKGKEVAITISLESGKLEILHENVTPFMAARPSFSRWVRDCAKDFEKTFGNGILKEAAHEKYKEYKGDMAPLQKESQTTTAPEPPSPKTVLNVNDTEDGWFFTSNLLGSNAKLNVKKSPNGFSVDFSGVAFSKLKNNQKEFGTFLNECSYILKEKTSLPIGLQAKMDSHLKMFRISVVKE